MNRCHFRIIFLAVGLTLSSVHAAPRDGASVYQEVCAACHDTATARTPPRDVLANLEPGRIVTALETGSMRVVGNFSVNGPERVAVAEYLTGKKYDTSWADSGANQCAPSAWPDGDPLAKPRWNGWGNGLDNARFQAAAAAGMTAADIPKLRLKWAFAFPGESFVESQPTVVGGRIFIGSPSGVVYAIDTKSGCTHWTFSADGPVKSPVTIAPLEGAGYGVFFGDQSGRVYSVDAASGTLRWKVVGDDHPSARVTGGVQVFEGRVYVPMASLEEALAMDANYRCCVFRGSVTAYNTETGERLWKQYTIDQEPNQPSTDSHGNPMVGPSGASVWSAVTIDATRRRIYVGTGDNYSNPPSETSDSVLALDLESGRRLWAYQGLAGDAWNVGCMAVPKINCPVGAGPDEDMGASPILVTRPDGTPIVIATQKSGVAHAIDPLKDGALVWRKKFAKGGLQGGFQWGQATHGDVLFASKSDTRWLSDSSISADTAL
ncbi:MAG: polyvinyl alcohol dehydrogenase (cytochrome), partial [Gammaproteobacteria bacterium]